MAPAQRPPEVLFLAPVEPWCRENGSSVVIADQLEGLLARGAVRLLPIFLRRPPEGLVPVPPEGLDGVQLGLEGVPRWLSVAKALLFRTTPLRVRFDNAAAVASVDEAVRARNFHPTVVHVEHLPLVDIALALGRRYGAPVVYRSHNIEAVLLGRRAGLPGPLGAMLRRTADRSEADAMRACAMTLCISDVDLAWARQHAPDARSELMPCSLLMSRYDRVSGGAVAAKQLAFVGGLDWAPNEVGLRWFVDEVWPRLRAAVSDATLAVLARGAAQREWLQDKPGIELLPPEAQALDLFASSRLSIAPLLQGGGVRIKIPESLAVGCPVVATSIGAEGHDLPGILRADEPRRFAEACASILTAAPDPLARRELRDAVEARHGATVHADRLQDIWNSVAPR